MDIAAIIAHNLTALMERHPDRDTLEKVAAAAGVGFGTVRRAKNGDGNLTVQKLELIARAFRRTARDLLVQADDTYQTAPLVTPLTVQEPSGGDERELLLGYRQASSEVRDILLDLARKAAQRNAFELRSEKKH